MDGSNVLVVMVGMGSPVAAVGAPAPFPAPLRNARSAELHGPRVEQYKGGGGGEATGRLQRDSGVNEAVLYLTLGL